MPEFDYGCDGFQDELFTFKLLAYSLIHFASHTRELREVKISCFFLIKAIQISLSFVRARFCWEFSVVFRQGFENENYLSSENLLNILIYLKSKLKQKFYF